jgi:hypothetical protein
MRLDYPGWMLIALLTCPPLAWAQTSPDSTAKRSWPINLWLSGGLGPAGYYEDDGFALRASGTLSVGRFVVLVRDTDAFEGLDGYSSNEESAVLAGLRFGNRRRFLVPAIGISRAHWKDDAYCYNSFCSAPLTELGYEREGRAFTYDLGFHLNYRILGVAVNAGGVVGPAKLGLRTMVISLEAGWFGR